jgi:gamma-glutamylcyclotransferase (GGCT)/AIG2-like uncharacterized protein YtfP
MNKNGLFVFYGTLRYGMENYMPLGNSLQYIDTLSLKGYRLFSLGDYPYAINTGHLLDVMVADLIKITDKQVVELIHQMELEAGYVYQEIEINGVSHGIYLFQKSISKGIFIESGDWTKYLADGF